MQKTSGLIWRDDEIEYLKKGYADGVPLTRISDHLGRSYKAIERKARKLGFVHTAKRFPPSAHQRSGRHADGRWTDTAVKLLCELWHTPTVSEDIAKQLNGAENTDVFNKNSVISRAHMLGLGKKNSQKPLPACEGSHDDDLADITADTAKPRRCVWPASIWPLRYCGAETGGEAWCAEHRAVALVENAEEKV